MVKGMLFMSVYATMAILFMSPLVDDRGDRGKRPQDGSPYPFDYENYPLLRSPFSEHSHGTHIFMVFAHSERSIHILLPQTFLS